jgi:alkylation response protein AidB-like acyl-CoA dehydrogenase
MRQIIFLVSVLDGAALRLFAVPAGAPGLTVLPYRNIDATGAAELVLDGVELPASAELRSNADVAAAIEEALDKATAALCAEAVGAMAELNALTLEYIKTRHQFGVAIGSFQVLQHAMVDMVQAEEQARSMMIYAAEAIDRFDAAERRSPISQAKAVVVLSSRAVGETAMQLHGGIGFTSEYIGGHYYCRLVGIGQTFGDVDWHLQRVSID